MADVKMQLKLSVMTLVVSTTLVTVPLANKTVRAADTTVQVTEEDSVKASLNALTGKTVSLRLQNGDDITGVVEAIGPTAVRIGKLSGKEFYSSVIVLSNIIAVTYRAKS